MPLISQALFLSIITFRVHPFEFPKAPHLYKWTDSYYQNRDLICLHDSADITHLTTVLEKVQQVDCALTGNPGSASPRFKQQNYKCEIFAFKPSSMAPVFTWDLSPLSSNPESSFSQNFKKQHDSVLERYPGIPDFLQWFNISIKRKNDWRLHWPVPVLSFPRYHH